LTIPGRDNYVRAHLEIEAPELELEQE
jgi:hypothetical protein